MSDYPEHDKLSAVKDESQAIGGFLDWLKNKRGLTLCETIETPDLDQFYPDYTSINELLAEYFDIDLKVIEQEKRAMLDVMRAANARGGP